MTKAGFRPDGLGWSQPLGKQNFGAVACLVKPRKENLREITDSRRRCWWLRRQISVWRDVMFISVYKICLEPDGNSVCLFYERHAPAFILFFRENRTQLRSRTASTSLLHCLSAGWSRGCAISTSYLYRDLHKHLTKTVHRCPLHSGQRWVLDMLFRT